MAALAGIGFTVSIFVAGLAYGDASVESEAKIGVLAASLIAAILGSSLLLTTTRASGQDGQTLSPGDDAARAPMPGM